MAISYIGLTGAVLNFAGGVFLTWDALRIRRKTLAHFGARQIAEEEAEEKAKKEGKERTSGPRYVTADGQILETELDWELWLASTTLKWTWLGFLLIASGFLLDIWSRIFSPGA